MDSHWENNNRTNDYYGDGFNYPGIYDVMISFFTLGNPRPITEISKQFLIDIGYEKLSSSNISNNVQASIISNNQQASISCVCGTNELSRSYETIGTINLIEDTFIYNNR